MDGILPLGLSEIDPCAEPILRGYHANNIKALGPIHTIRYAPLLCALYETTS